MTISTKTLFSLTFVFSCCLQAATIQEFTSNSLSGLGSGGTGYMNPYLYTAIHTSSGCSTGTELLGEGSWTVDVSAYLCHSLWNAIADVGADAYFLMVNGSAANNGRVYSQVVSVSSNQSGVFSGYFTGLYSANPASLTLSVYDGSTSAVLGSASFTTNVTNGVSTAPWIQQSVSYAGASGSTIVVEISLNSAFASGNDFGVDLLDVSPDPPFARILGAAQVNTTPEPSTWLLCGCGLMGLARARKRLKQI